jgi:hypothetical protein
MGTAVPVAATKTEEDVPVEVDALAVTVVGDVLLVDDELVDVVADPGEDCLEGVGVR